MYLGRRNIEKRENILSDYTAYIINILKKKADGMRVAGMDTGDTDRLIDELKSYI